MILFILFTCNIYSVVNNIVDESNNNIIDDFFNDWAILTDGDYLILTKANDNAGWELIMNIDGTSYMFSKDGNKTNLLLLTNIVDGNTWYLIRSSDGANWKLEYDSNYSWKFIKEDTNWKIEYDKNNDMRLIKDRSIWSIYKDGSTWNIQLKPKDNSILPEIAWEMSIKTNDKEYTTIYTTISKYDKNNYYYLLNNDNVWTIEKNDESYWNLTLTDNKWNISNTLNSKTKNIGSISWSSDSEETMIEVGYDVNNKYWYLTNLYGSYWTLTEDDYHTWALTKDGVNIWKTIEKYDVWVIDNSPTIKFVKENKDILSTGAIVGITIGCSIFAIAIILLVYYMFTYNVCGGCCNIKTKFAKPQKTEIMP